jgi:hypothetical protein
MLYAVDHEPEQVLRLVAEREGLSIALDQPRSDDQQIECDGAIVLVIEPEIVEQLSGQTLDVNDGPQGGLKLVA